MPLSRRRQVRASDEIDLVTIPNVELLEVGLDWETSTGVFTFTAEDLQSAIDAVIDPAIRTAVLKFGHTDPRFDGDFSVGRIENLHLSENGMTLLGDYVGVPRWLAEIMPAAYPRRSIEGLWDVETYTGNRWPFQLTAVALLGTSYPAIATIEDIKDFWGGDPVMVEASTDPPAVVRTPRGTMFRAIQVEAGEVPKFRRGDSGVQAAVEVDDIRRQYYDQLETTQMWWWIRAIQIDPPQLIVDDDDGSLYRVGYSVSGDEVEFADPVKVKVEYQDVSQKAAASTQSWDGNHTAATYPTRDASRRATVSPRAANATPPEDTMNEAQKALIGLPADATDEQVTAKLTELAATAAPAAPAPTPDPAAPAAEVTPPAPADPPAPAAPAAVEVPEGMVLVDAATLDEMKRVTQAVSAKMATDENARRKAVVDAALKEGKFPRSRREHYDNLMASTDPKVVASTEALIAAMEPGLIPVNAEQGIGEGDTTMGLEAEAYPSSWLPEVAAHASTNGSAPTIVKEP